MHNRILTESLMKLKNLGVHIIPPRDAYGKHNIPSEQDLVWGVIRALSSSALKDKGVLITGGPTPVAIDGVRRLTNKFTGRLAIEIAQELHLRGARVKLILGAGSTAPPPELVPCTEWVSDFDTYLRRSLDLSGHPDCQAGVFSAAVADYQPVHQSSGKIESGLDQLTLKLTPTAKVIEEIRCALPQLTMVTFKYQEDMGHDELMNRISSRLSQYEAVFANRGEEQGPHGEQVGWLCTQGQIPTRLVGKPMIAQGIVNFLEQVFDV